MTTPHHDNADRQTPDEFAQLGNDEQLDTALKPRKTLNLPAATAVLVSIVVLAVGLAGGSRPARGLRLGRYDDHPAGGTRRRMGTAASVARGKVKDRARDRGSRAVGRGVPRSARWSRRTSRSSS